MSRPIGLPKTGGRKPGTPNKTTAAREAQIRASGLTPLDFMLQVMRDENAAAEIRLDAAARAAPYVHPRLSSIAVEATSTVAVDVESIKERERRAAELVDRAFGRIPNS